MNAGEARIDSFFSGLLHMDVSVFANHQNIRHFFVDTELSLKVLLGAKERKARRVLELRYDIYLYIYIYIYIYWSFHEGHLRDNLFVPKKVAIGNGFQSKFYLGNSL